MSGVLQSQRASRVSERRMRGSAPHTSIVMGCSIKVLKANLRSKLFNLNWVLILLILLSGISAVVVYN